MRQIRASGAYLEDPEVNDYLNELGHRLVAAIPRGTPGLRVLRGRRTPRSTRSRCRAATSASIPASSCSRRTNPSSRRARARNHARDAAPHGARRCEGRRTRLLYIAGRARARGRGLARQLVVVGTGHVRGDRLGPGAGDPDPDQFHARERVRSRSHRLPASRSRRDSTSTRWRPSWTGCRRASRFADGNAPSYLRTHPVTYERVAEAQSRAYGKPYRQVTDSLDFHLVRALLRSYQGTAEGGGRVLPQLRSPSASSTARSRRATASSRRCCAAEEFPQRDRRARRAREDGAAASDDRGDGRPRADGIGAARSRHRALQVRARALPEQAAARLRLSAGAARKAGRLREAATLPRDRARALSAATVRCIGSRRARTPTSARSSRSTGTRASSTRGRATSRRRCASSSWRRRRATAISIRRPSSRRGCARCARSSRSSRRSEETDEAGCNFLQVPAPMRWR